MRTGYLLNALDKQAFVINYLIKYKVSTYMNPTPAKWPRRFPFLRQTQGYSLIGRTIGTLIGGSIQQEGLILYVTGDGIFTYGKP